MIKKRTYNIFAFFTFAIPIAVLMTSCHPAKHVPEDKYLLNRVNIEYDSKDISQRDIRRTVRQMPNRKTLSFFRFHLMIYNVAKSGKERKLKNRIAEVIGEPPVIYDEFATEQTERTMISFLESQGFYEAEVSSETKFRRRYANVTYNIETNLPHIINRINYNVSDLEILDPIDEDLDNSLLQVGKNLNIDVLQKERERLVRLFKSNGFFYFSLNNIHYYVDTTKTPYNAEVTLAIRKSFAKDRIDLDDRFVQQEINNVYIYANYNPNLVLSQSEEYRASFDTIIYDGIHFIYSRILPIKPNVLLQACFIRPGELYDINNVEKTHSHYTNLRQFRLINIRMEKPSNNENLDPEKFLDCHIFLTPLVKQYYELELEGNNTSGNIGASGSATYHNRNIFKGAESFSMSGSVSLQSITASKERSERLLNTFETTGEMRINFPRLLFPYHTSYDFTKTHNPTTRLSTSYSYQQRPDYTRGVGSAIFGYVFKSGRSPYITHSFNPLEFNLVKIYDFNPRFWAEIDSLFIRYSYEDQLLTSISYGLRFNNQPLHRRDNFSYFRFHLETSGNLMNGIHSLADAPTDNGAYQLMGLEFAQFVKVDFDYRFYQIVDAKRSLVYRCFFGIGVPYGNSVKGLPFIKKYFTGGANDIRAWQVRSLGPGSYTGDARFNQIGDMKMVFNIEYRFPLISFMEGAIFLDAGNIWAVDKKDDRPGALFEWDRFYKEIAIGTGIGTRFDFSFFIIRFDFGVPLYDPIYPEDARWLRTFKDLKFRDFTLNFGIGYPF